MDDLWAPPWLRKLPKSVCFQWCSCESTIKTLQWWTLRQAPHQLRRAPPLALWQVRALPPLRWGLGIPPLPWLQGVSLDPIESPHPNCLVQRSQKCKSMDWVKTSRAGPIQRCTLSSQRACRRSASHAGAKCFSKLVRSSWAQKAALGEDGWTAHQAHWDTNKKSLGFQKALVLAPGLSVQTMRLWAWLVQGYSILAENGMAGMTSPYGVTNLSHARWSVIPRIHAVLYLAGWEIPASPQTQNHVSPQDYCWVITLITLTRDQSALLSMFRVDSMTSIITYFSQGFSTPVEAPRAQKHGPKSLGPKNQWHGCHWSKLNHI